MIIEEKYSFVKLLFKKEVNMKVWVLIPAYNEESYIFKTVKAVKKKLKHVLVVDDGSKDKTVKLAKKAKAKVLSLESNQGKGRAKQVGFDWLLKKTDFQAVVTMDADGQHSPEDLDKFLATKGDVVIGNRMSNTKIMPKIRYLTNLLMSFINSLIMGCRLPDTQCDYRLIRRGVLEKIRIIENGFEADTEFLFKAVKAGFSVKSIPIETIYLKGRKSKINPLRDTILYLLFLIKRG